MPEQRDPDEVRLIEIEVVLEHLQRVKADAVKMTVSLRKRDRTKAADPQEPGAGLQSGRPGSGSTYTSGRRRA